MKIKRFISIVLFLVIFAFILIVGWVYFGRLLITTDAEFVNTMAGAFAGAFFAFLFVRLGDALTRCYDRQKKNYNGLVRLQYLCNEYLGLISDNIFLFDGFSRNATSSLAKDVPFICTNAPLRFVVSKDILLALTNIDLINEVSSLYDATEKMNHSIDTIYRSYSEIKDAFIQKTIDYETYQINVLNVLGQMKELKEFLLELDQEVKRIAAITRVLLEEKPFLTYLIQLFSRGYLSNRIKNRIPGEIKKLEAEIETIKADSAAKINRIRNN